MAEQLKIKMKDIVDNIEIKIRAEEMVYCFNDSNDIKEFILAKSASIDSNNN